MIKNVVFDVGMVLVDFRWRELMEDLGLPKELQEVFGTKVFGSRWWKEYDLGVMSEDDIIAHLKEDNKEHIDEFNLVWQHLDELVAPYDYAVPWIKELKSKGLNVYLLSNYPKEIFTLHTNRGKFPFLNIIDGKVVSGFVKKVKPNAEIYEYLINEYNLIPEETVFIDDLESNIEGARACGINGIVLQSYEQAKEQLDKMLG